MRSTLLFIALAVGMGWGQDVSKTNEILLDYCSARLQQSRVDELDVIDMEKELLDLHDARILYILYRYEDKARARRDIRSRLLIDTAARLEREIKRNRIGLPPIPAPSIPKELQ